MENTDITSEASAENEVDTNANTNLSLEDFASSFMEKVETNANESSTEATDDITETEVVDAEEEESEVLSQSNTETEDKSEEEETEESDEPQPKGLSKAIKQIGRLTARAKGAEEEVQSLREEIQSLKSSPAKETQDQKPALDKVNSLEDLEALRKEALSAKKWAIHNLGRDLVEIDGKEYEDQDIRNILTEAEDHLSERIPERAKYLQEKQAWAEDTAKMFPYIYEAEGSEYERYVQIRQAPQYKTILDNLPNGDFVAGVLCKGIEAIEAEQKTKPKAKKPQSPPPDEGGAVAPPVQSKDVRQKKAKEKALGKGNVSVRQFAEFLT